MMTTLTARPEAITFDPQQSALIVVDMQNAYATPGGYLDLAGFDVSTTRPVRGNCWRKAPGIINWWMNWCRSLAILCCRSRATAVSSIRRWTAFCAAVEYAIWFSPVSLPTSASNRRYATAFFWSISAWCWKTQHILEYFGVVLEDATHQAGPEFAQKAALFNIETFFGWVSDVETFCDALSSTSFARIA